MVERGILSRMHRLLLTLVELHVLYTGVIMLAGSCDELLHASDLAHLARTKLKRELWLASRNLDMANESVVTEFWRSFGKCQEKLLRWCGIPIECKL